MAMHDPAHPGEILKELVISPLGLTVSETAQHLGISRNTLHRILKKDGAITAEMAVRLETAFGKPNASHWLRLQNAYDLWKISQEKRDLGVQKGRGQHVRFEFAK